MSGGKYRSTSGAQKLIGLSISYERENLLRRGMKIEHLRELLLGIAGPLIRGNANVAYAGYWRETDDNFTYDLLQLISAERDDPSVASSSAPLGWLYNHLAWPIYLTVTPQIEAQWIHCCRIIRITQPLAGISPESQVADSLPVPDSDAALFNSAVVLSAMRRIATAGMTLEIEGMPTDEYPKVPRMDARVLLGGKTHSYGGFLPGLFEEALFALERNIPLYVLGGFGGSAGALCAALLSQKGYRPPELTMEWHEHHTPQVKTLQMLAAQGRLPAGMRSGNDALDALYARIDAVRGTSLAAALKTGLSDAETVELMTTIDIRRAVYLCLKPIVPDAV